MADYSKPLPLPSPESEPFWAGARDHKLLMQKCASCGEFWFPPGTICPHCGAQEFSWAETSGRGRVFTFVTFQRLYNKAWDGELPYVVAIVELEEGPRMLTGLTGIDAAEVVCDLAVRVVFDDVTPEVTLPKFTPV